MNAMNPSIPLLVVETIEADPSHPQRVAALIKAGGHPLRVVLDFSRRERIGVEYVEMPGLLEIHRPSQLAVVQLMERVFEGERVATPADLTEQIRQASPPSPYEPLSERERAALEAAADTVSLEVHDFQRSGDEPCRFSANLSLDGREFGLTGEIYAGVGRIPIVRWRKGPDPRMFSKAQHHAIQRALVRLCEINERSESRPIE